MTDPRLLTVLLLSTILSACGSLTPSFYRLDVRQGNTLKQEQIERLQPGMTKRQVQNLMGSPAVTDPFRQNRWDYIYTFYPAGDSQRGQRRHITLYFEGELLARIDDPQRP